MLKHLLAPLSDFLAGVYQYPIPQSDHSTIAGNVLQIYQVLRTSLVRNELADHCFCLGVGVISQHDRATDGGQAKL